MTHIDISDEFSSLSDDDVMVLFCFLCCDSGTPDFTDTDWREFLNEMQWNVFGIYSVTSEEAQWTLDGLKSRGFLWNQDGLHLTEDAMDETMYRVTRRASSGDSLWYVYSLSCVSTAVRYLRSQGYTRKSGEKCVIGNNLLCDSLLIQRLQMNIMTHVTMEDMRIYDDVSMNCKLILYFFLYSNIQRQQSRSSMYRCFGV
jgi:hypothetical protein